MGIWDNLPVITALLLASAAALASSDTDARQEVTRFLAEALKPQAADLGGDPGYLLGVARGTAWPEPAGTGAMSQR